MALSLNNEVMQKLKCSTCSCYISVGPVTEATGGEGYECGRCSSGNGKVNVLFQSVAEACVFPCRYDVNGCTETLKFGKDVVEHEKNCDYRPSSCPVEETCEWKGSIITAYDHYKEEHPDKSVNELLSFELDLEVRTDARMLKKLQCGEILQLHVLYSKEVGLSVTLKYWIAKQKAVKYYDLVLKASDTMNDVKKLEIRREIDDNVVSRWIPNSVLRFLNAKKLIGDIQIELKIKPLVPKYYECYNARYGCDVKDTIKHLEMHEKNCKRYHCFIQNCSFNRGMWRSFWSHVMTCHDKLVLCNGAKIEVSQNKINKNVYFLSNCGNFLVLQIQVIRDGYSSTAVIIANRLHSERDELKTVTLYVSQNSSTKYSCKPLQLMADCTINSNECIRIPVTYSNILNFSMEIS